MGTVKLRESRRGPYAARLGANDRVVGGEFQVGVKEGVFGHGGEGIRNKGGGFDEMGGLIQVEKKGGRRRSMSSHLIFTPSLVGCVFNLPRQGQWCRTHARVTTAHHGGSTLCPAPT